MRKYRRFKKILIFFFSLIFIFNYIWSKGTIPSEDLIKASKLYVFGDSLSDQGNLIGLLDQLIYHDISFPPSISSHGGKVLTDGKLILEIFADSRNARLVPAFTNKVFINNNTGIIHIGSHRDVPKRQIDEKGIFSIDHIVEKLIDDIASFDILRPDKYGNNFAFAGASINKVTGSTMEDLLNLLSLPNQINSFITFIRPNLINVDSSLFIIFMGGNDLIYLLEEEENSPMNTKKQFLQSSANILVEQIKRLQNIGAKKILVLGPPDIGSVPRFFDGHLQQEATELSSFLHETINDVLKSLNGDQIQYISVFKLINQLLDNHFPTNHRHRQCVEGFDKAKVKFSFPKAILNINYVGGCNHDQLTSSIQPFYDDIHPTEALNRFFVRELLKKVKF